MITVKGYTRIKRGKIERVDPYSQAKEKKLPKAQWKYGVPFGKIKQLYMLENRGVYDDSSIWEVTQILRDVMKYWKTQTNDESQKEVANDCLRTLKGNEKGKDGFVKIDDVLNVLHTQYIDIGVKEPNVSFGASEAEWNEYDKWRSSGINPEVFTNPNKSVGTILKAYIEGQAINELETNGYKVWTGLPRRKRPVWLGSLKTPEQAKEEKEFEDEVMRVTNTIWDYIGDNVDYVVLEKSKQIFVPASMSKKAYYRFDPRGEPIQVEPPGGAEHPDPKYTEVVRRIRGQEEFKEEEVKPERREFQSRGSGEGRRKYRSARSSRSRSTIRRIGS